MTPFITYTLILFLGIYGIAMLLDLVLGRSRRAAVVQLFIILVFTLGLNVSTGFPVPKMAFGGMSPLLAVSLVLGFTMMGMAAHYVFHLGKEPFSWSGLLRPFVISPIILLPLLGTILNQGKLTSIQLISFSFLAFQNGFFWKLVLKDVKSKI